MLEMGYSPELMTGPLRPEGRTCSPATGSSGSLIACPPSPASPRLPPSPYSSLDLPGAKWVLLHAPARCLANLIPLSLSGNSRGEIFLLFLLLRIMIDSDSAPSSLPTLRHFSSSEPAYLITQVLLRSFSTTSIMNAFLRTSERSHSPFFFSPSFPAHADKLNLIFQFSLNFLII